MTVVVDASVLVAISDDADPWHEASVNTVRSHAGSLVVPAPVTAETDYLLGTRLGRPSRHAFLDDLAHGRFEVACLTLTEHAAAAEVDRRYEDLDLGLADAAVIVMAHRYRTRQLATLDERCFRAVTPLQGGAFTLLPLDAG